MRKVIMAALIAAALGFSGVVSSFEVYKDYVPSKEVWNVTFVKVAPNRIDDYLEGLRQTWWNACDAQKKNGTALDCEIYLSETAANRDFNVLLVIKGPNAAVSDPDAKVYGQVMAEIRKKLAEDKEKKLVEGYDQMRSFFGEQNFRRIDYK